MCTFFPLLLVACVAQAPSTPPPGPLRQLPPEAASFHATEGERVAVWEYDAVDGLHTVVATVGASDPQEKEGTEDRFRFVTIDVAVWDYLGGIPARPPATERLECMTYHRGQDVETSSAGYTVDGAGLVTDVDRDGQPELTVAFANRCWEGRGELQLAPDPRRDRRTVVSWEGPQTWAVTGSRPAAAPGKPTEGGVIHSIAFAGAPLGLVERAVAMWAERSMADAEGLPDESVYDAVLSGEHRRLQLALDAHPGTIDIRHGSEQRTALHQAVDGPLPTIGWLLEHSADPNLGDDSGWSPLHLAVKGNRLEVVSALLDGGASVDGGGSSRATPLQYALKDGVDRRIALLLLEHGADPAGRSFGKDPLQAAVALGDAEVVGALLGRGVDPNRDDLMDVALRSPEVLRSLLQHGADAQRIDTDGRTLLERAARADQADAVGVLLDAGVPAPGGVTDPAALVAAFDARRALEDALFAAIAASDPEAAVRAIDGGANPSTRRSGRTPLAVAAGGGQVAIVTLLVDRGAAVNVRDATGRTPLHEAAKGGHAPVVELLLARGAEADAVTDARWPVVFDAAAACAPDIVRALGAAGVPLDQIGGFAAQSLPAVAEEARCDPAVVATLEGLVPR